MDWEQILLQTLKNSRPAYDEEPDWRAALALYDSLTHADAAALDRTVLTMINEDYRNPHSEQDGLPFDDVMVNLPAGMTPDDLLCVEAAVMIAAERKLGAAFFAFNRLMRSPRWHAIYPRLYWLGRESLDVQRKLAPTRGGRYMAALLGLAVGDALGATVEFMSRQQIRRQYPDGHKEIVGGGPFGVAPGDWTDDTSMALCVARGIIEAKSETEPGADADARTIDAIGRHFIAWYNTNPPDVGNACRVALEAFLRTQSWAKTEQMVLRELGNRAGGNGALMRTLPTALAYGPDERMAVRIGRMTHPHPESDAAIGFYHRMVDALLGGATRDEALAAGLAAAGPLRDQLAGIKHLTAAEIESTGYVVHTIEAALWAFLTTDTLEECIVCAVNLGDDTDTVGAVAGGLAGAYYGPLAIPRRWTMALKGRGQLEEVAEQLLKLS